MFNRKQIKENAKAAMKGHLGLAILVILVIGLLACVASATLHMTITGVSMKK